MLEKLVTKGIQFEVYCEVLASDLNVYGSSLLRSQYYDLSLGKATADGVPLLFISKFVDGPENLHPGEAANVILRVVVDENTIGDFYSGLEFNLMRGPKSIVAKCKILSEIKIKHPSEV